MTAPGKRPGAPLSVPDTEERYRLLVEGVRDYAIFMLDVDGHVLTWNLGAERIKGYSASDIVGQHFSRFYPKEAVDRGWPDIELARARVDGRFEDEGWRVKKDGTLLWANVVITVLKDSSGEVIGFSKITRDLTERRRHEEELRESEERFRLLVEGVQDYAIFMLDPTGRVASWNAGARRVKGWEAHEIIGQHFSRFYPQDAIKRGWPQHELVVARKEGRLEDEGWRIRKDGSPFWASVVITAITDGAGQLRGFAKVTRDLTERRRVEEMQEEGRQVRDFLAMLGHELRNPLGPISSSAVLLRDTGGTPAVRQAAEVVERQVAHLTHLVDDLLDLGRVRTGKISVGKEPIDLTRLVSSAVDGLRPTLEEKQHQIEVQVPAEPTVVMGDETRLTQVVLNLLHNAHKFTPAGGHVEVELAVDALRFAELRIRDDGIGIDPALIPRVFEPFVQGDRSLDRIEGGLGIGLTLVRELVELHGGTVSAHSGGQRKGTEIVVRLALAPPEVHVSSSSSSKDPGADPRSSGGLRVLVVDDNRDGVEMMSLLIEHWGYEVRTAEDGPSALVVVEDFAPDVVLLDIGLPGMDGYAVAEQLRTSPATLIAMTGYGRPEDVARAEQAGFAHHLVKPVRPERLQRILNDLNAGQ